MPWTLAVSNYLGLLRALWSPGPGLSCLIGPNGSGKTTLLRLPDRLRLYGLTGAVPRLIPSGWDLGSSRLDFTLGWHEPCLEWWVRVEARTWSDLAGVETIRLAPVDGEPVCYQRDVTTTAVTRVSTQAPGDETAVTRLAAHEPTLLARHAPGRLALLAYVYTKETPLDAWLVRLGYATPVGAEVAPTEAAGWVEQGLAECFRELGDASGWRDRLREHLTRRGVSWFHGGVATALRGLAAVALAPSEGTVALEGIEQGLHPAALRTLLALLDERAWEKTLTVLLSTQSPVVLDWFGTAPERVWVMEPEYDSLPVPLTHLKSLDWLSGYSLGDLYMHGEIGAPLSEGRS